MYDIAIIGGGVGGLVTASGSAQFGAKVALIEKWKLGGDCLNFGCVPTKTLIHSSRIFHHLRNAGERGIKIKGAELDFKRVMEHMREIQARIAVVDDPERFRKMGVDVFFGEGSFMDANTFLVDGREVKARKFLVATGSRPADLSVPGAESVDYLTNETILDINELPASMIVLGAGPIGMEYAQTFARFGCEVTVFQRSGTILAKEDAELTSILWKALEKEGVKFETFSSLSNVEKAEGGIVLTAGYGDGKPEKTFRAEKLFVSIGRRPNIENLNLEGIGVKTNRFGIVVDDTLKTTVSNIWACGDVTGMFPFTHMAEYEAGIVISNALFPLVRRKMNKKVVPWCTYTDPELARVGLTEAQAEEEYGRNRIKVYRYEYKEHDRAIIEGATDGLVKLVCDRRGKILGAHILGADAGNLIHEYTLAMNSGLGVQKIAGTVHVYPTMGQIVKRGADQYYREKLFSGLMAAFTKFWFGRKQSDN